jgi:hypothetical protein
MSFDDYGSGAVRKELEAIGQFNKSAPEKPRSRNKLIKRVILCFKLKKRNKLK